MSEQPNNENLSKVIEICQKMLELADLGDRHRLDAGCGVVFGTLRDDAYKILKLAKKELTKHLSTNNRSIN